MGRRGRKIVGVSAMTIFVLVYVLIAMEVGARYFYEVHWLVQLLYYALAGLAWIFPAGLIILWMRRAPG